MKKLLAIVLALACCLSCFAFVTSVSAAEATPGFAGIVDWSQVDLSVYTVAAALEVDDDGLLNVTPSVLSNDWAEAGIDIIGMDDETGLWDGTVLEGFTASLPSLTINSTNYASVYLEIPAEAEAGTMLLILGTKSADENGELIDGTTDTEFYGFDLAAAIDWADVADGGFAGWVNVPLSDAGTDYWGLGADENGVLDLEVIQYVDVCIAGVGADVTIKVGEVGFYSAAAALADKPAFFTPWFDFTDWTEEDLAPLTQTNGSGNGHKDDDPNSPAPWTATATVDENGLVSIESNNEGYDGYWVPGLGLGYYDGEAGTGVAETPNTNITFAANHIDATSEENGLAFYVDTTKWEGVVEGATFVLIFVEADCDENGEPYKKQGNYATTGWNIPVTVEAGYKGWVTIPFSEWTVRSGWGEDTNGCVDLVSAQTMNFYINGQNGNQTLTIGHFGFYGPAFYDFDNYADQKPEDFTSFLDFTEWTDEHLEALAKGSEGDTVVVVPSVDEDGLLTLTGNSTLGYTDYWAPQFRPAIFDDESGDIIGGYPGATISFADESLKIPYKDNNEAGISMFLDLSKWEGTAEKSAFVFIMEDVDFDADGNPVMDKGLPARTNFQFHVNVEDGFVGWVNIPFSEMTIRGELNPGSGWREVDENGYLDLVDISKIMLYCNVPNAESVLKIGHVGFYGISEYLSVEEGPSTPEDGSTPDDGNDDENPDTGVTGVAGVASVAAIIALAAVVCFRKKD